MYSRKLYYSTAIAAVMLLGSSAAMAQSAAVPAAGAGSVDEVVVTGSRIIRDGYASPTPLAVVSAEALQVNATGNVAGLLDTMPAFLGSVRAGSFSSTASPSAGTSGLNFLSIRGLGPNRSLVLIDGQRVVPTLAYGTASIQSVDLGNIPQQLLARVETVTGGASAIYGSDAVGGVTNFVLDHNLTGLRADVSVGETAYKDNKNVKLDVSGGMKFAGGKGHIIGSASFFEKEQVQDSTNRAWNGGTRCVLSNPAYTPTNGLPQRIFREDCGSVSSPGGLITTGPLRGLAFGQGGVTRNYTFGTIAGASMYGGDYKDANIRQQYGTALDPSERRKNVFARASYDLTDKVTIAYTGSWGESQTETRNFLAFRHTPTVTISNDNAFIPVALRPALANTPTFAVSTLNVDLGVFRSYSDRWVTRHAVALDGAFKFLGEDDWKWNAYYQTGLTRTKLSTHSTNTANYTRAVDAVTNAAGQIVCRVNRVAVTDPACAPYNVFGIGVNSAAAINYINGRSLLGQSNQQDVWAGSLTGDAFSLWAGPVSVALNLEHRVEKAKGYVDPGALANAYFSGNYKPINGKYNVTEAAIEVLVPLLADLSFVKKWDLDLAYRVADYSTSGSVGAWKVGSTFSVNDDLKFRGYVSRDIRAGNLGELFATAGSQQLFPAVFDPITGQTFPVRASSRGNPDIQPEKARSYGAGVVYQSSWIEGLSASVDYWNIDVKNAISAITSDQALALCFNGNAAACSTINRVGTANIPGRAGTPFAGQLFAPIDTIVTTYINLATFSSSGVDLEASYRRPVTLPGMSQSGRVTLTWNEGFYRKSTSFSGLPGAVPTYTAPFARGTGTVTYDQGPAKIGLTARYQSKHALTAASDPQTVECAANCPAASTLPVTVITQDTVPRESSVFLDAFGSYKFDVGAFKYEAYVNIRNLTNRDPVLNALFGVPYYTSQTSMGEDGLGRTYRIGLRIAY